MRTAAIVLGVLAAVLIFALGYLLYGMSFGAIERHIPGFWQLVLLAAFLAMVGGIATWWRATLGTVLMAGAAFAWLLLHWRMMQTLNLFDSTRGTVSDLVMMLSPPLLLGLAIYLALKGQNSSAQNPS